MKMQCVNNRDYEDCMTIGKVYDVDIEDMEHGNSMKKFLDDNGNFLQTMLDRFKPID